MGRIEKSSTARHDATLSPIISNFISDIQKCPVHQIPAKIATFPGLWPFPRGDLYHWIPALDQFDSILERCVKEYGLDKGPQSQPFSNRVSCGADEEASDKKEHNEIPEDADFRLLHTILRFTTLLLENCGNRSIYNSSSHLNNLLNTTDLRILTGTLEVAVRLSMRYFSSRQRSANNSLVPPLHNLVAFNLDNIHKLASPFSTGTPTSAHSSLLSFKGKESSDPVPGTSTKQAKVSGSDLSAFVGPDSTEQLRQQDWTTVSLSYYAESKSHADSSSEQRRRSRDDVASPSASPTAQRASNIAARQSGTNEQAIAFANEHEERKRSDQQSIEISRDEISSLQVEELVAKHVDNLPTANKYDLLHKIRIAKAISSGHEARELLIGVRLLAVANLAYICGESVFQQKVGQNDSDEQRRLQLAYQTSELLQPSVDGKEVVSRRLQTIAIQTLEALTKQPKKSPEVNNALMSSQNHGVLFYMVRKVVAQLAVEDGEEPDYEEEDWREALLALLVALPTSAHRQADHMVQAGMLQILVDVLQLRTAKADRFHARVLGFLDSFIYNVRDAFQTWASAKGLDAIAELTLFEVETAFDAAQRGEGIPENHKTSLTDYSIPFFKQQTIRMNFKFINHMMTHTGTNIDRLLRNLIDSPPLLSALRTVLRNASTYGSNAWSSAATILSNFIHNEPTSYAVIAEAGLSKELLEAVTRQPIGDDPESTGEVESSAVSAGAAGDRKTEATGILPVAEAITAVPQAFGAICLTEAGMKLFKRSGALDAFFDIFESAVHVKAMGSNDRDVASELGHAFDELVRHHPSLRTMTLVAVRRMLENSLRLCSKKARDEGSGIKLWVLDEEQKLVVSGGRHALDLVQDQDSIDVEMANADDAGSESAKEPVSSDEVEKFAGRKDNVDASEIISVVSRFLVGFFSNSTICTNFIDNGGMEYILDLATHPGLEHDFKKPPFPLQPSISHQAYDVIRLLQMIMEQKPHLGLPPLLNRIQRVMQSLAPFTDSADPSSFFSTFAYPSISGKAPADFTLNQGTLYVKRLQTIYVLCSALMSALMQNKTYTHRASSTIANQVNLTDVYITILEGLGKLQSACEWEWTILMRRSIETLKERKPKDPDSIPGQDSEPSNAAAGSSSENPQVEVTGTNGQPERPEIHSVPEKKRGPAFNKNIPLIESLLDNVSQVITPLRLAFGKILLLRPRIESYPKQNAIKVAEKLAQCAISQLQYSKPTSQDDMEFRFKYFITVVRSLEDAMIEGSATDASGSPTQILTLVIQSFKNQGGFDVLRSILESCAEYARSNVPEGNNEEGKVDGPHFIHGLSLAAIQAIVAFYAQVINSKNVNDATQSQALLSRERNRDRERPDYFSPSQFLVELRTLTAKPVMGLWESDFMNLEIRETARYILDILRIVLEGDSENGAWERSNKIPKKRELTPRTWSPRDQENLRLLENDYGADLAREALFRCNDNYANAREYCSVRRTDPRSIRNRIPQEELTTPTRTRSPAQQPANGDAQQPESRLNEPAADNPLSSSVIMQDVLDSNDIHGSNVSPPQLPALAITDDQIPRLLDFTGAPMPPPLERDTSTPESRNSGVEAAKQPDVITVDDLDELRASLRTNMIDRILDVLNVHPDLTFELADLINATISKAADQTSLRQEIGTILVQSLISLKMDDDEKPEDWRAQGKKIASCAHLLALTLQDRQFYNAALSDLKDNFEALIGFIRIYPVGADEESVTWVGQVLLILEKLLSHDLQPNQIKWTAPSEDTEDFDIAPISPPEQFLPLEEKQKLLQSLIKILPKIGKDATLALSVIRALVMLTRTHKLAKQLGEKQNIRSLFLMVRQLNGLGSNKLQNGFMLILRHIVEDDEIIRNIMRNEIQQAFESRSQRPNDVATYVRQMSHLVLRSPDIFVEVTTEKLRFTRWDTRMSSLTLKKDENTESGEGENSENKEEPKEQAKPDASAGKSQEIKAPVVGHPDGVIHYLLCELLAYKDVKDAEQKEKPEQEERPAGDETATNSQLLSVDTGTSDDAASVASADVTPPRTDQKFKPEDHTIYMYRCFLLQCLAELLSSYNRTKIEFINFSRKSDPQNSTPSKPRAGILNYLLNSLVPTGSIAHPNDIESKKNSSTSGWAVSVLVALCSETGETGTTRKAKDEAEPDSDLIFVRKFVLDHAIRAFKDAQGSSDPLEMKYSRLLGLSDLFHRMLVRPPQGSSAPGVIPDPSSPKQLAKMMYEKNFVATLTNATTEIDLNFPNAKRAIKYILKPLKYLLHLSIQLSQSSELPLTPGSMEDDAISSASSSVSEMSHDREETPDLYRNSTLGFLEPNHDEFDEAEDMDEDVELYDDGYPDDMEFDEEQEDEDDVVSDDEDDGVGPIEGMPGEGPIDVEVVMDDGAGMSSDDSDDDDDMDEDDDMDDEDDDEDDEDDEGPNEHIEEDFIDDNGSLDDHDAGWEEEEAEYGDFHDFQDENGENGVHGNGLDNIVSLLQGDQPPVQLLQQLGGDGDIGIDMGGDNYLDEEDMDDMEGDEEDEEDDYDEDDDLVYRPDFDDDDSNLPPGAMWGTFPPAGMRLGHPHHHHHHHGDPMRLDHFRSHGRDPIRNIYGAPHRSHRPGADRGATDGTNPLLARPGPVSPTGGRNIPHPVAVDLLSDFPFDFDPLRLGGRGPSGMGGEMPFALINQILSAVQQNTMLHGRTGPIRFSITGTGLPGQRMPNALEGAFRISGSRSDPTSQQPTPFTAVYFVPGTTIVRWQEEAALLFGTSSNEKANNVINSILRLMVPPAIKAQRIEAEKARKRAEEEAARLAKEEAEKKEREAKEKKEQEEREAAEAAQREAEERARAEEAAQHEEEHEDEDEAEESDQEMEDMEATEPSGVDQAAAADDQPRVTINLRGREFDITGMGIDREYLEALPEEFREEAIMTHVASQRSQAVAQGEEPSSISREFLEALPPGIRQEILEQEAQDRRRREQEEERRRRATEGGPAAPGAEEMDTSSFLATLDPQFRQVLLMEQDDATIAQLPAHIAEEARLLNGERRLNQYNDFPRLSRTRAALQLPTGRDEPQAKPKPRPYPQMLDKSGVAGLLRLMFVPMQGSARQSLNDILRDICMNKQNRAEVISILLSILQDGSTDIGAVERSFAQLSLRAKQGAAGPKSPHPLRRTLTGQLPNGNDLSPLTVVQQCLGTLSYLTSGSNSSMALFFLTEHETSGGIRHRTPKKGKGKEVKAIKFPLNALLSLLDRKVIMDSSQVMEQLASLLQIITNPLNHLLRKEKEAAQQEKPDEGEEAQTSGQTETETAPAAGDSDVVMTANDQTAAGAEAATNDGQQPAETTAEQGAASTSTPEEKPEDKPEEKEAEKEKKTKTFSPPEVPEANLRLVVNIFATRECGPKAFRDTLALITNLSAIPDAKEVFGQELVRHAHDLGIVILQDLEELLVKIENAKSGTDLQGVALAKFSPATSDQAKLLRIFLALDYLFDPKRAETPDKPSNSTAAELNSQQKEHILASIYDNSTFGPLWTKLSECLTSIRVRGDMFNVAAVLQPLIEVLMVVCKNTTLKDAPLNRQVSKEFAVSSPQPEAAGMENLFFTFTEEHRKILNDLVRQNPKLMSGSFSLMVKNSKVLEFDNKRNFFSRELHRRTDARHPHSTLQLQVRRDQVFLDSFKSLYFKSGDEMKYGKLNIRFHGEEGVDAGGVTREWFQVLSKQMFNPDYALFNPVASDRTTFHPNAHSMINPEHLMYFKFIGRIIGKALYEGRVLDCHFSRAVYKRMLGKAVNVKDMESLDLDYYKSLLWMLENDITDIITETFSVQSEVFGETKVHDLKENGRNIPVTEANKHEYVRLVVENRLTGAVTEQLEHFLKGFHEIVPAELISIFNEQELELLISGLPDIDVDDWKNNSSYQNYTPTSPQIQWFWRAVRSFDKEERAKLLQFVTGTSKVPLNGFKELEGMNGFSKFTIHRDYGNTDRLPSSHTCFNQLDLPEYDSYETLRHQLYTAMTAGNEYFALA
ncbi:hypothetical protein P152DRAFT_482087 [Eremomyces bilateralis CBS 781.70]|uniref:HECT-type E3 ubiquitin transferase n=1 Tax=Eremomyces bilateralis CBS 781.70 TaxID=1392243 RepID=A0A6G1G3H5_9PEZI|nr:uncharacterized protein P152DRAFT_482087 [Eremomyces bilateralis CBS 781.70]KAF1812603.1 hypothetical protein P152DRAFT_482087 [Eremomyces bilateralis CBS 781.70]